MYRAEDRREAAKGTHPVVVVCLERAKVKSLGEGGRRNLTMNHSGETRGRDAKWKSAKNKEGTSEQL